MASQSAVIDMDGMEDVSDFDDFGSTSNGHPKHQSQEVDSDQNFQTQSDSFFGNAQGAMTKLVWEAGKTQATKAWTIYGNIDYLRPYFDVEPRDVVKRCLQSLIPKPPTATPIKLVPELYGPTMLVLTLIALLLFEMKSSGHTVREGTLIGTAFGTCFGYWLGCGSFIWLVSYVCNTHISYLQTLSLLGYSLTSHCLIVLLSTVIHTSHDHAFFYLLWSIFGGLSTLRMASIFISRTHGPSQKLILCGIAALVNLMFLLYLHFAYHQIVEDLNDIMQDAVKKPFVQNLPTEKEANPMDQVH